MASWLPLRSPTHCWTPVRRAWTSGALRSPSNRMARSQGERTQRLDCAATNRKRAAMTATKPASGLNTIREFLRLESASGMLLFAAGVLAVVAANSPLAGAYAAFLDVPSRVELMGLLRQLTRAGRLAVVLSTHDLELALRTADVVWLVMPGGELMTGAPEDVVLAGGIGEAFEGRQLRFHPEERNFRLLTGNGGEAVVRGSGLRAALAQAVLEREGYAVVPSSETCTLCVHARESGWQAVFENVESEGADFASLAAFLRGRRRVS